MNLLVHGKELLKEYNAILDKISNLLNNKFNTEPVYNDKYVTAKIKIYNNRINTKFQGNTIPEDNEYCNSLSATLSDSVVKIDNNYYPQIFSEECKYAKKKKKKRKRKRKDKREG